MFGKNPIRKPENHDGNFLKIQEIFYTIQGEGIYSGYPAVFVRLGGCNLACKFCDTDFIGTDGTLGGKFENATRKGIP